MQEVNNILKEAHKKISEMGLDLTHVFFVYLPDGEVKIQVDGNLKGEPK